MRNYNMDKFKAFAIVSVVVTHALVAVNNHFDLEMARPPLVMALRNLFVPGFLMIQGLILSKKKKGYGFKYARNMLAAFLAISVMYYLFSFAINGTNRWLNGGNVLNSLRGTFFSRDVFSVFNGTFGSYHLWYLFAASMTVIFIEIAHKFNRKPYEIFYAGVVLFFMALVLKENGMWWKIFRYGGIPEAAVFITTGYYVGKLDLKWKWYMPLLTLAILGFYVWVYLEVYRGKSHEILMVGPIFMLATTLNTYNGTDSMLARFGRHSDAIFLMHPLGLNLLRIFWRFFPNLIPSDDMLKLITLTLVSIIFSILIYPWLNRVYVTPFRLRFVHFAENLYLHELPEGVGAAEVHEVAEATEVHEVSEATKVSRVSEVPKAFEATNS